MMGNEGGMEDGGERKIERRILKVWIIRHEQGTKEVKKEMKDFKDGKKDWKKGRMKDREEKMKERLEEKIE